MRTEARPDKATSPTLTTRTLLSLERASAKQTIPPWVWPLPRVQDISPSIQCAPDEQGSGVIEIGYPADISISTPIPVLASRDGIVTYAARTTSGATLCLHHPGGWSTQYEHLTNLATASTDRFRRSYRVHRGSILGYLQHVPLHIRFSLSRLAEQGLSVVDPVPYVSQWHVLRWSDTGHGRKRLPA